MTRPVGEIRQALLEAIVQVHPAHYRQLAEHVPGIDPRSPAELQRVRQTLMDMARPGGALERVGSKSVAGACRPLTLFAPRRRGGWVTQGLGLQDAMRAWVK